MRTIHISDALIVSPVSIKRCHYLVYAADTAQRNNNNEQRPEHKSGRKKAILLQSVSAYIPCRGQLRLLVGAWALACVGCNGPSTAYITFSSWLAVISALEADTFPFLPSIGFAHFLWASAIVNNAFSCARSIQLLLAGHSSRESNEIH